jgi:GrpB-like predicted nucleotidyltransferase (UPF0157 family)
VKIIIEPYTPDWTQQFACESTNILAALQRFEPLIQHIGSTAVVGLPAKPIIDILLGLASLEELNKIIPVMQSLGYSYVSKYEDSMPNRRYFVKYSHSKQLPYIPIIDKTTPDMWQAGYLPMFHVHSVVINSEFWERHIAFREYLRHHPKERDCYGIFKQELATQEWENGLQYSTAKHDFIQAMERTALEWYRKNSR